MLLSRTKFQPRLNRQNSAPKSPSVRGENEYTPELFEFDWPELPSIELIQDAVQRNKVSGGIGYVIPVDQIRILSRTSNSLADRQSVILGRHSVACDQFPRNNRALNKSHNCKNIHSRLAARTFPCADTSINADSEKYRQQYIQSAPAGSSLNSDGLPTGGRLKRRANFVSPIKSSLPPEAIWMRKEAEKVLQSAQEDDGDYQIGQADDKAGRRTARETPRDADRKRVEELLRKRVAETNTPIPPDKPKQFDSYNDARNAKAPPPLVPVTLRSDFLTNDKNQEIWRWLHFGEEMTDFQYFLAICGS